MPVDFLLHAYLEGVPAWVPPWWQVAKYGATLGALVATKLYCSGPANRSERAMHGRVVMMTGGTSGVGAAVALDLARRGAHLVLLTAQPPSDPFVVDYVEELRARAGHALVYAEQVDLASLHSIRTFATRWIDSLPVRRLDMVILCAATAAVPVEGGRGSGTGGLTTPEGIERAWMVNYLANFHLLSLLSPALKAQPFDRDVRVILTTCSAYIGAPPLVAGAKEAGAKEARAKGTGGRGLKEETTGLPPLPAWTPQRAYARSKLALMVFARAFQKHVDAHVRPDGLPSNVRVLVVDPGLSRTPGFRRWLAGGGSLLALVLAYVLLYPLWWLLVQSADDGAQSVLFAAMDAQLRRLRGFGGGGGGTGGGGGGGGGGSGPPPGTPLAADLAPENDPVAGKIVKACRLVDVARRDVDDLAVAEALWRDSDALVEATEKRAAALRAAAKEGKEGQEGKTDARPTEAGPSPAEARQIDEIASLVAAIKKGKEREAQGKAGKGKKSTRK